MNNRGEIAPLTAAEIAKAQGIRVYTIGVGTEGMAPYPAIDMFGNLTFVNQKVEIDEKVLKAISVHDRRPLLPGHGQGEAEGRLRRDQPATKRAKSR